MEEKDFNNLPEKSNLDFDYEIPNEVACSAEFSGGCIFVDND